MFTSTARTDAARAAARADARTARSGASEAFVALDDAHRTLTATVTTFAGIDAGRAGQRVLDELAPVTAAVNAAAANWIDAVDRHDAHLEGETSSVESLRAAQTAYDAAQTAMRSAVEQVDRFAARHTDIVTRVQQAVAELAPKMAQARTHARLARESFTAVANDGMTSPGLDAAMGRLEELLELIEAGATLHGAAAVLRACAELATTAQDVQTAAADLRTLVGKTRSGLASTTTRMEGVEGRLAQCEPTLSSLRRRFSLACSTDLDHVPATAKQALDTARAHLAKARELANAGSWVPAAAELQTARDLVANADTAVNAVTDRLRDLEAVAADPAQQKNATRFAVRDAQGLVVSAAGRVSPNEVRILDSLVTRLEQVDAILDGGVHPDYWSYLRELRTITELAGAVVRRTREALAAAATR